MSEFKIDVEGLSLLEVIKRYPEAMVAAVKRHGIEESKDQLEGTIKLVKEYIEDITKSNPVGTVRSTQVKLQGLIEWLEDKLEEVIRTLDYSKAKAAVEALPKYYIGQEVMTEIGKGILVEISMPSNGLYLSPERTKGIVWYSTQDSKGGFVQREFELSELNKINEIE